MKVAISNIAWDASEEPRAALLLQRLGVRGVEVAPGKIGDGSIGPAELADGEIRRYRDAWNQRGIEICAMQALLFGKNHLAIFAAESLRREMLDYLARIVRLGGLLGARALVFGSPKNRRIDALDRGAAHAIALAFFRELGAIAADHETCVCIEPNPPAYGADWITSAKEAQAFVDAVAHPGVGLHLDAGALHMMGEGEPEIRAAGARIRHFHASQPNLVPLCAGGPVPHERYAATLRAIGYSRWVSIEMRRPEGPSSLPSVETGLEYALATYGG